MKQTPEDSIDPDLERALNWFLSFLDTDEWQKRKNLIEEHLEAILAVRPSRAEAQVLESVSIKTDKMGWYLYLVEMLLYERHKYEPSQGARVVPIFKRIGADIDQLVRIRGVQECVVRLLTSERDDTDSGLFELMTALLWARNGWPHVEMIPRSAKSKTPDIKAPSGGDEWFIECKRLGRSSGYSLRERQTWLKLWRVLADFLIDHKYALVFDIVFHVELEDLPDTFLVDQVSSRLGAITSRCAIVEDDLSTIMVWPVDFERARAHLAKYYVKYPSDQLSELVGGRREPNRGFACVVGGRFGRIGADRGNNRFLESMSFAAGAFWHCDAERAIERKARDVRRHLAEAVEQLPERGKGVVHIGIETLDGWLVEAERYGRIAGTVYSFDTRGKDLRWIYCHLLQPYSPPDTDWVFDETVYYYTNSKFLSEEPLKKRPMIIPWEGGLEGGVHWLRDTP